MMGDGVIDIPGIRKMVETAGLRRSAGGRDFLRQELVAPRSERSDRGHQRALPGVCLRGSVENAGSGELAFLGEHADHRFKRADCSFDVGIIVDSRNHAAGPREHVRASAQQTGPHLMNKLG